MSYAEGMRRDGMGSYCRFALLSGTLGDGRRMTLSRSVELTCMISDEEVRRRTGRGWHEWLAVLDEWGTAHLSLVSIVDYLMEQHQLEQLWAQTIAVYYRQHSGERKIVKDQDT